MCVLEAEQGVSISESLGLVSDCVVRFVAAPGCMPHRAMHAKKQVACLRRGTFHRTFVLKSNAGSTKQFSYHLANFSKCGTRFDIFEWAFHRMADSTTVEWPSSLLRFGVHSETHSQQTAFARKIFAATSGRASDCNTQDKLTWSLRICRWIFTMRRVAIISGAGSGIGRATALLLSKSTDLFKVKCKSTDLFKNALVLASLSWRQRLWRGSFGRGRRECCAFWRHSPVGLISENA